MEVRKQKGIAVVHVGNLRAGAGTGLGCRTLLDDFHPPHPKPPATSLPLLTLSLFY